MYKNTLFGGTKTTISGAKVLQKMYIRKRLGKKMMFSLSYGKSGLFANRHYKVHTVCNFYRVLHHFFAEGEDGGEGELEVLQAPRDTHDGTTKNQSKSEMREGNLPPTQKNPKYIEYNLQAASAVCFWYKVMTEWPKRQHTHLE